MRAARFLVSVLVMTEIVNIKAAAVPPVLDMGPPMLGRLNCLSFNGTNYPVATALSSSALSQKKRRADNPCWLSRNEDLQVALPTDRDLKAGDAVIAKGTPLPDFPAYHVEFSLNGVWSFLVAAADKVRVYSREYFSKDCAEINICTSGKVLSRNIPYSSVKGFFQIRINQGHAISRNNAPAGYFKSDTESVVTTTPASTNAPRADL